VDRWIVLRGRMLFYFDLRSVRKTQVKVDPLPDGTAQQVNLPSPVIGGGGVGGGGGGGGMRADGRRTQSTAASVQGQYAPGSRVASFRGGAEGGNGGGGGGGGAGVKRPMKKSASTSRFQGRSVGERSSEVMQLVTGTKPRGMSELNEHSTVHPCDIDGKTTRCIRVDIHGHTPEPDRGGGGGGGGRHSEGKGRSSSSSSSSSKAGKGTKKSTSSRDIWYVIVVVASLSCAHFASVNE
jgi:hypothetical protein